MPEQPITGPPAPKLEFPKPTGLLGWKPSSAGKWWMKATHHPMLMGLIQGAGGYAAGRHVAAPLWEYLSPSHSEEAKRKRQMTLSMLGAGAGLLPPAMITAGRMMSKLNPETGAKVAPGMGLFKALLSPFNKTSQLIPAFPGTKNIIMADPILSPYEKAVAIQTVENALQQSSTKGMFTVGDLVRGAIGAGLGYTGARVTGTLLGLTFGASPSTQKRLGQFGTIGGILANTGILRV